ncbi:hypothetical protein D3C72_2486680 [compost metagenome]
MEAIIKIAAAILNTGEYGRGARLLSFSEIPDWILANNCSRSAALRSCGIFFDALSSWAYQSSTCLISAALASPFE